jgi:hypothetical protein
MWHYFLIPPNIKIVSNVNLSEHLHNRFALDEADLIIFLGNIAFRDPEGIKVGAYITSLENGKTIAFKQRFLGSNIYMLLSNIEGKPTKLYASTSINRVVKLPLPMRDLVRFNDLVNSLILIKLIQRGWILAHAASLLTSSTGLLITGYPDTGKTTTTYLLSRLKDFIPLSDDLTYISENSEFIGGSLSSLSLSGQAEQEYFKKTLRLLRPRIMLSKLLRYASYVPYAPSYLNELAKKLDSSQTITITRYHSYSPFKCKFLFILELGNEEQIIEVDKELAAHKFLEINRREYYYFHNNFMLTTYSYFNKNFNLESIYKRRAEIVTNFCRNVNNYLIRARKPSDFYKLILHILQREGL